MGLVPRPSPGHLEAGSLGITLWETLRHGLQSAATWKCGSQTSSFGVTWELLQNAESRPHTTQLKQKIPGGFSAHLCLRGSGLESWFSWLRLQSFGGDFKKSRCQSSPQTIKSESLGVGLGIRHCQASLGNSNMQPIWGTRNLGKVIVSGWKWN